MVHLLYLSVGGRAGGGGGGDANVCNEAERGQHRQPEGVAVHRHAFALPSTLNSEISYLLIFCGFSVF